MKVNIHLETKHPSSNTNYLPWNIGDKDYPPSCSLILTRCIWTVHIFINIDPAVKEKLSLQDI